VPCRHKPVDDFAIEEAPEELMGPSVRMPLEEGEQSDEESDGSQDSQDDDGYP
jgi:hypothetical protein